MKKMLTTLALAAFAISGTQAGQVEDKIKSTQQKREIPLTTLQVNQSKSDVNDKSDETLATFKKVVSTSIFPATSIFASRANSMTYDPETGLTLIVAPEYVSQSSSVSIYYSSNKGTTWTKKTFYDDGISYLLWPNIAVAKPGAKNFGELSIAVSGLVLSTEGGQLVPTGNLLGLFGNVGDITDVVTERPKNYKKYAHSGGSLIGFSDGASNYGAVFAGTLDPDPNTQYGLYGMWSFDLKGGDYIENKVPQQWELNQFTWPSDAPGIGSSYNSTMTTAADPEGVVYAWVSNFFPDDNQVRVPAFSKSEDGGATWTEFEKMPSGLFAEYAAANGGERTAMLNPYSTLAAVATGNGKTSYYLPVIVSSGSGQQTVINSIDLAEAAYNGSSWSFSKVATLNGNFSETGVIVPGNFNRADTVEKIKGTTYLFWDDNPLGFEVQASRDPDGSNIVVKWLNYNYERSFTVDPPVPVMTTTTINSVQEFVDDTIKGGYRTDIYMAYKSSSGSSWTVQNVTNDDLDQKGSKIPSVIPGINSVPVLNCKNIATNTPFDQLIPATLKEKSYYSSIDVSVAHIDLQVNSVNDNAEEVNTNFTLRAPTPNPASDMFSFSYSTSKSGNVQVVMRDALGRLVSTIHDGYLASGIYANNVNTANFNAGVYYVTVTLDGKSLTKAVTIVR